MKKLNKLVDGIESFKNKMITRLFFFIVIGAGLSVTSFGQTGQSAEFYDPIAPLFPTDAQECRDLRDNWNERLNALLHKKNNCTKQASEMYSGLEHARENKGRDFPSCPSHLQWTVIVYECSPQHLGYCHAWDRRDKQVKDCFASVAEAVPDNSEELIAIYDRIEKEATDTYDKVNPSQSTGQQIARNQFKDSMKKISNIHRQVLRDLAQVNARLEKAKYEQENTQSKIIQNSDVNNAVVNQGNIIDYDQENAQSNYLQNPAVSNAVVNQTNIANESVKRACFDLVENNWRSCMDQCERIGNREHEEILRQWSDGSLRGSAYRSARDRLDESSNQCFNRCKADFSSCSSNPGQQMHMERDRAIVLGDQLRAAEEELDRAKNERRATERSIIIDDMSKILDGISSSGAERQNPTNRQQDPARLDISRQPSSSTNTSSSSSNTSSTRPQNQFEYIRRDCLERNAQGGCVNLAPCPDGWSGTIGKELCPDAQIGCYQCYRRNW